MKIDSDRDYLAYLKSKSLDELMQLLETINKSSLAKRHAMILTRINYLRRKQNIKGSISATIEISSLQTEFLRYTIGPIFFGIWAIATALAVGKNVHPGFIFFLAIFLLFGLVYYYLEVNAYRKVSIDKKSIFISNFRETIRVDLDQIAQITQIKFHRQRPITIHFNRPTAFGMSVTFIPRNRLFEIFHAHPIIKRISQELKES